MSDAVTAAPAPNAPAGGQPAATSPVQPQAGRSEGTSQPPAFDSLEQRIAQKRNAAEQIGLRPPDGVKPEEQENVEAKPEDKQTKPTESPELVALKAEHKAVSEKVSTLEASVRQWEEIGEAVSARIQTLESLVKTYEGLLQEAGRSIDPRDVALLQTQEQLKVAQMAQERAAAEAKARQEAEAKAKKDATYKGLVTKSQDVIKKHPDLHPMSGEIARQFWSMVLKNPNAIQLADMFAEKARAAKGKATAQQAPRTLAHAARGGGGDVISIDREDIAEKHKKRLRASGVVA